jgi:hypothetical protein
MDLHDEEAYTKILGLIINLVDMFPIGQSLTNY